MGLAVCQFINKFIHKYTKARSNAETLTLLHLIKQIVIFTIIMFPQALISPPPVSSLFSASAIVVILIYSCVIAFSLLLSLIVIVIFYMIWDFFFFFPQSRQSRQSDLETGDEQRLYEPDVNYDSVEWHEQEAFYQAAVLHNMRVLEILDRVIEELEERKKRRQKRERRRALEKKLPPTVCYGSHESEIIHCKDCAICLQEFEIGDMCQVLPSCNHTFHSKCINHWLRENLTCPICRNRVIDL